MAELFPDVVTTAEMLDEVEREIAYRKHVYPRLTSGNAAKANRADRRIAVMQALAKKLADELKQEAGTREAIPL